MQTVLVNLFYLPLLVDMDALVYLAYILAFRGCSKGTLTFTWKINDCPEGKSLSLR